VSGNTIADYQKTGVLAKGVVSATITGNTIDGYGPVGFIAQNGVQVSAGAAAQVSGNSISDNYYSPTAYVACGLLLFDADGVKTSKNTFSGNEKDLCNFGRGGGKTAGV
jgi:nitrous oxidase accessory protein NosD